jgi:hypothetical protein
MLETPVLLIGFNRPENTIKVLEAISKVKPKKLYVHLDSPRENNIDDNLKCLLVQKLFYSLNWECELLMKISDKNLGCTIACTNAIDWFFDNEEEGIILEDDCVPSQSFFLFCSELLNRYRYNHEIGIISGSNLGIEPNIKESYYFSKYAQIWGWASWKRAWENREQAIKKKDLSVLTSKIKNKQERLYWRLHFSREVIWDVKWAVYSLWKNEMIAILPKVNLVTNIGFGINATNYTFDSNNTSNLPLKELANSLIHPSEIQENYEISQTIFKEKYLPLLGKKKIVFKLTPFIVIIYLYFKNLK